jgi:hypothetical protein
MSSQDLETIAKPLTVNHETSKLYSALRQCMKNNAELRDALLEATETIQLLTEKLNESKSN